MKELLLFFAYMGLFIAVMVLGRRCDACRADQLGELQVSELRGKRIEMCDGSKWVPATVPVKP